MNAMNVLKGKGIIRLLVIILFGLVLMSGSSAWRAANAADSEDFNIYLNNNTFDPLQFVPAVPANLQMTSEQVSQAGLYLVQFTGPVLDEWKQQIVSAGAQLGPYIPEYSFLVKMDSGLLPVIQGLDFVRWVGPFEPAYKLSPDVNLATKRSYTVALAPWASKAQMDTMAVALDPQALSFSDSLLVVLDGTQLEQMAFQPDVLWIEPFTLRETDNNVAGGDIMNGATAWANGYTGQGITIAVADTGLDTGNPASIHLDFMNGGTPRVAHISSYPVLPYVNGSCSITNAAANDGASDLESGHGTHVTGSVAGNGARSSGTFKGLAYNATITFQAMEEYTMWSSGCASSGLTNGYYLTGIPDDIRPVFTEVYNWGARVQNDSWGGGTAGVYDQQASYFDDFIFNHQDFSIVVAAGNAGADTNHDGYVDNGSVNSPATAKNVIAVGASESERSGSCSPNSTTGYAGCTYNYLWGSTFGYAPTSSDVISNNRGQMAAFSSRGPTADTRIRPDVVAPGTDIISTRSSLATEAGWGAYNSYYESMGGTSMASPLTSGAAAVVRQFLIQHEAIADPSAALVKADLINTAVDIPGYGNASYEAGAPIPNNSEGWGRVDVGAATAAGRKFIDGNTIATGNTYDSTYTIATGAPFKVTLVWSDYPATAAASVTLVNDLNLKLVAPNGTTTYWGNMFSGGWSTTGGSADARNNVENVYIQNPTAGTWHVQVIGQNVPHGPQPYALVVSGNIVPNAFNKISPVNSSPNMTSNVTLSWQSSSGAVSYSYCVDQVSNTTCDTGWNSMAHNTSVSLNGLAAGTYYWQIEAINPSGNTQANGGTWWTFTVRPTLKTYLPLIIVPMPAPGAFGKSAPGNGASGQPNNPTLSWAASSNAASYDYCIDTVNNSACDGTWSSVGTATTVGLSSLSASTIYYWQARANNSGGTTLADGGAWWSFTTAAPPGPWTTIMTENFEGSFPNGWNLLQNGQGWGKRNCGPYQGSYSGWAVGGSNGGSLSCGSNYPLNAASWMIYGPFNLTSATAADLSAMFWFNTESGYDKICFGASTDNNTFYGSCWSGNSGGWVSNSLDLSNVYTLGNLLGQPSVYIAFWFTSDDTITYPDGGYVDNILLRKCMTASCTSDAMVTTSDNPNWIEEPMEAIVPK